jgi:DNA polymerase-3 subunit chi
LTEVGFYHLTRSSFQEALPRLLEKAYAAGNRVLVRVGDPERLELLNRALWTYGKESFLPHGTRADGFADEQPIFLTTQVENPNAATILALVDDAPAPDLASFVRCLDLFDGADPDTVARARQRWRDAAAAGHNCVYWQQTERGGWAKVGVNPPPE